MAFDFIEEELKIMEERSQADIGARTLSTALDISDPIKKLNLDYIITVEESMVLEDAVCMMSTNNFGCLVITNSDAKVTGIFTERDVLRKIINKNIDMKTTRISEFMTHNPITLDENDPIAFALNKMSSGSFRHIPITRSGQVKFMLSIKDIVDHISLTYRDKVLNLPPSLETNSSTLYGG